IRECMSEDVHNEAVAEQAGYQEQMRQGSDNWGPIGDFLDVISNGHRSNYEAWRYLIYASEHSPTSGIPEFDPFRLIPTAAAPDIADQYGALLAKAQEAVPSIVSSLPTPETTQEFYGT